MMQSIDVERQLVREVELKTNQRRRLLIATVALALLSAGLLAGVIVLSVVHIRHLHECSSRPTVAGDMPVTLPVPVPVVPEAPPVKRLVVVPVNQAGRRSISSPYYPAPGNGTSPRGQACEPGSVLGGQQLDELDHDVYMSLMQKAVSLSQAAAQQGRGVGDYYHASLRSIFRCVGDDETMGGGVGGIEIVAVCESGYVAEGDTVECDGEGSYEGGGDAAPASPSDGSGYTGI